MSDSYYIRRALEDIGMGPELYAPEDAIHLIGRHGHKTRAQRESKAALIAAADAALRELRLLGGSRETILTLSDALRRERTIR